MITRIARLRAKKGFTIIELIVVMAVIGVLTAIVVAALSYDQKPIKGKGIAKDVFYVEQEAFCSAEITEPLAMEAALSSGGGSVTYTKYGVYISFNEAGLVTNELGEIDKWGTVYVAKDVDGAMPACSFVPKAYNAITGSDAAEVAEKTRQLERLNERLLGVAKSYLEGMSNMKGTLIVLADAQYRCVAAYWTDRLVDNTDSSFSIGSAGQFVDNNRLDNGYYCSAYPTICSIGGSYLFNTHTA